MSRSSDRQKLGADEGPIKDASSDAVQRSVPSRAARLWLRVIVANEPRFYREVLAAAFRGLRPTLEVFLAEPANLADEVGKLDPQFVLCSELTDGLRTGSIPWILLYPAEANHALINVDGRQASVPSIELDGLLDAIDQALLLASDNGLRARPHGLDL